jgi:hypothetical protein
MSAGTFVCMQHGLPWPCVECLLLSLCPKNEEVKRDVASVALGGDDPAGRRKSVNGTE